MKTIITTHCKSAQDVYADLYSTAFHHAIYSVYAGSDLELNKAGKLEHCSSSGWRQRGGQVKPDLVYPAVSLCLSLFGSWSFELSVDIQFKYLKLSLSWFQKRHVNCRKVLS